MEFISISFAENCDDGAGARTYHIHQITGCKDEKYRHFEVKLSTMYAVPQEKPALAHAIACTSKGISETRSHTAHMTTNSTKNVWKHYEKEHWEREVSGSFFFVWTGPKNETYQQVYIQHKCKKHRQNTTPPNNKRSAIEVLHTSA